MRTVRESAPTSFDHSLGAFRAFADKLDWLVCPASQTRDSGLLARVNFKAQSDSLDRVDPEGADHESHTIGHWGPGWYEITIVRPLTKAAWDAMEIEGALENYPVLDDSAYSEACAIAREESWRSMRVRDRLALIQRAGSVSILKARHDECPHDDRICEILDQWSES